MDKGLKVKAPSLKLTEDNGKLQPETSRVITDSATWWSLVLRLVWFEAKQNMRGNLPQWCQHRVIEAASRQWVGLVWSQTTC